MLFASIAILTTVILLILGAQVKSILGIKLTVTVPHNHIAVIERFGRPSRSLGTGLHLLFPWEKVRGLKYLRTQRNTEPFRFSGLTKDKVRIELSLRLGVSIAPEFKDDPAAAYYKCMSPIETVMRFLPDTLNRLLPQMDALDIYGQPGILTETIKAVLDEQIRERYGHVVRDVHLLNKQLPPEIEERMQRQYALGLAMHNETQAGRVEAARTNAFEAERIPVELATQLARERASADATRLHGSADADASRSRDAAELERITALVQALRSESADVVRGVQAALALDYMRTLGVVGTAPGARTVLVPGSPGAVPGWPEQFALLQSFDGDGGNLSSAATAAALAAGLTGSSAKTPNPGSAPRTLPPPVPPAHNGEDS